MADRDFRKEVEEYKAQREARILRRAKMYIDGEIDLDGFFCLENLEQVSDRCNIDHKAEAAKLEDLNEMELRQEAPTPKRETPARKAPTKPEGPTAADLDDMTPEEFRALSIREQSRYFELAPEKAYELLKWRPAYMDIIDPRPKPKDYSGTTVEEFKKMHLNDLNDLYKQDRDLYMSLREQSRE